MTLVDHDVVEMKNCGHQAVSVQAAMIGGVPKVANLALRLNSAYGLDIEAWPVRYEESLTRDWFDHGTGERSCVHLIVGYVDMLVDEKSPKPSQYLTAVFMPWIAEMNSTPARSLSAT